MSVNMLNLAWTKQANHIQTESFLKYMAALATLI